MSLSWYLGGQRYELDDRDGSNFLNNAGTGLTVGMYMTGHSGLGNPPVHILSERGPLQNGITYRGYRLEERLIMFSFLVKGDTVEDLYNKRSFLNGIFRPSDTLRRLRFEQGSTVRQIDGVCIDGFDWDAKLRASNVTQKGVATILCPDPRWYDPTIVSADFALGGGGDAFEIPFEIPFGVGASTIDITEAINYAGNVKSYPTIYIDGPITDFYMKNVTTGHELEFDGVTIGAGDQYVINLGYADNTVEDDDGDNKIAELSGDLTEFCIDPDFGGGVNSIQVTGSSVSEATRVRIAYYNYYIGV